MRRAAARAYARILDADDAPLLRALEDTDDGVVAWAGYGLGESCRGKEEAHVWAMAARLASLPSLHSPPHTQSSAVASPDPALAAILRALGRCGTDAAEETLRAVLRKENVSPSASEAAAYALGEIAARRGALSLETAVALLDAAEAEPPLDAAFYAFGRSNLPDDAIRRRLVVAARAALGRPGPGRVFAVRALGRSKDSSVAGDLAALVASSAADAAERVEAARSLAKLAEGGHGALVEALGRVVPQRAEGLAGDSFGVLLAAIAELAEQVPDTAKPLFGRLARFPPGSAPTAAVARRVSALRCAAAGGLARGEFDSGLIAACDVGDGQAGERARLAALDRGSLAGSRRTAWRDLAGSKHLLVREAALDVASHHPELEDALLPALAEGLSSDRPGVVATAAELIQAHPERAYTLAASERRAALDPAAPPPTTHPARELDARIAKALRTALARAWPADAVETRTALVDASLAVALPEARDFALAACRDPNTTLRARAARALAASGERDATCPAPDTPDDPAPELGHALASATRVTFETDAGASLAVVFDPAYAPVATTRFVALARGGFYTGVAFHRVVPAFVVQFGDPGGDGYGGSGRTLRCETSPVPFGPLDVGVALAGRDTGSSQLFVTLARHPNLDGEYAWVGRAEGDWDGVAEGDLIREVRVEWRP